MKSKPEFKHLSSSLIPLWIFLPFLIGIGLFIGFWSCIFIYIGLCWVREKLLNFWNKICCEFCKKEKEENGNDIDFDIDIDTDIKETTIRMKRIGPSRTAIAMCPNNTPVPLEVVDDSCTLSKSTNVEYGGTKVPWCTVYM